MGTIFDAYGLGQSVMDSGPRMYGSSRENQLYAVNQLKNLGLGGAPSTGQLGESTQASQPQQSYDQGAPYQDIPGQQDFSSQLSAIYDPIFASFAEQEAGLEPQAATMRKEAEQRGGQLKSEAETEQSRRLGEYSGQRAEETAESKSVVGEARRLGSQLMQKGQAMFGGSTSAGGAYGEIIGQGVVRAIGKARTALTQTLSKISEAETAVKDTTTNFLRKVEEDTTLALEKVRNWLGQQRQQINQNRNMLQSEKASQNLTLLRDYQGMVQNIKQQNQQFKQQLYTAHQEREQQLADYKNTVVTDYDTQWGNFDASKYQVGDYQGLPTGKNTMRWLPQDPYRGKDTETEDDELSAPSF